MECLQNILCGNRNIIGINNFGECIDSESKLNINDLPGITLKNASKIADEELQSGLALLKHSIKLSTTLVYNDFKSKISPYFDFNTIVESRQIDNFSDEYLPGDPTERGLILKRWRSELAQIYVQEVYVKIKQATSITIKIYDGCEVIEKTFDTVADCVNTFRIDYKAKSEQIKIVFDQTTIEPYTCPVRSGGFGCGGCGSYGRDFFVTGWNGVGEQNKCFGLGVYANVKCYEETIFCSLLDRLYLPLWYRSGMVFCNEYINTNRVNYIATFGKEQAEKLLKQFTDEYNKEYDIFAKNSYMFIKSMKGDCATCNGTIFTQQTP